MERGCGRSRTETALDVDQKSGAKEKIFFFAPMITTLAEPQLCLGFDGHSEITNYGYAIGTIGTDCVTNRVFIRSTKRKAF